MRESVQIGLLGCGHRGVVGFLGSLKSIGKAGQVVALCDTNPARLQYAWESLGEEACARHTDLDAFLQTPGLTTVIVATRDAQHAEHVLAAFRAGKDVVCEKPMATTLDDCAAMIAGCEGRSFRVAFNLRYNAVPREVKRLLHTGAIGRVLHVQARDDVGLMHGADYLRRWHRFKRGSGGLLVHKSTHTFDVVNWWLDDRPESVSATAARSFFTPDRQRGERCRDCDAQAECPFYADLADDIVGQESGIPDFYRRMYLEAEEHDGYIRDACVFHRDNEVEDQYQVTVRYRNGALLSYTAVFFASRENRTYILQGTEGRIEVSNADRSIRVRRNDATADPELHEIASEAGGHGGADVNLMRSLFEADDRHGQEATAEDGYWSLAIGAGAETSLREGNVPVAVPPCHVGRGTG